MSSEKIYDILLTHPDGLTQEELIPFFPETDAKDLANLLNVLLSQNRVEVVQIGNDKVKFVALSSNEAEMLKKFNDNEKLIYQHIKASQTQGIWLKDLIRNTNLHRALVLKSLKTLEQIKIVKAVQSVKTPSKKIYMLYDLTPSVDLTGGTWFTDNELDLEFIKNLSMIALQFIYKSTYLPTDYKDGLLPRNNQNQTTLSKIHHFLNNSGITDQPLSPQDVEELLNVLVLDNWLLIIPFSNVQGKKDFLYNLKPNKRSLFENQNVIQQEERFKQVPCVNCPVIQQCDASFGKITPKTCVYFDDWIDLI